MEARGRSTGAAQSGTEAWLTPIWVGVLKVECTVSTLRAVTPSGGRKAQTLAGGDVTIFTHRAGCVTVTHTGGEVKIN